MLPKAGYSTPLLHVADIARSLRFYELLGFELIDTEGEPLNWARMHCEGGALMFLAAEPGHASPPALMLVMYAPNLAALREHLLANGVAVSAIKYPAYMPSGEINFRDPDGNFLSICHWGKKEHEAWEKRLIEKKKAAPQE
jgi:catechol 2,3-dioxygenase-like lactoylglutathione lyase family enzyme